MADPNDTPRLSDADRAVLEAFTPERALEGQVGTGGQVLRGPFTDRPELVRDEPPSKPPGGRFLDPEGQRLLAQLAVTTTVGHMTGGFSLVPRVLSQLAAGGTTEAITRMLQGEEDVLLPAVTEGGIAGTAEAVSPLPGKVVGSVWRFSRGQMRGAREAFRKAAGKSPLPQREVIESVSAPFVNFVEEGGQEAFETAVREGGTLLPGQVIEHQVVDTLETMARVSVIPTAGQRLQSTTRTTEKLLQDAMERVVATFPKFSRGTVAQTIEQLHTGQLREVKGVAQSYFRRADKLLAAATRKKTVRDVTKQTVDTGIVDPSGRTVTREAEKVTKRTVLTNAVDIRPLKARMREAIRRKDLGLSNPKLRKMAGDILEKEDVISFESAAEIRSDLFEESGQFNPLRDPVLNRVKGVAEGGTKILTRQIDKAARAASPEGKAFLDMGRKMWREEVRGELTDRTLMQLLRKQPEDLIDAMIRTGRPGPIRMVRDVVMKRAPKEWEKVQGSFLRRIMFEAVDPTTGVISGKKLTSLIRRFGKEDEAALNALFPGASRSALNELEQLGNALQFAQKKPSSGTGSIFFNLMQAQAIGSLGAGIAIGFSESGDLGDVISKGLVLQGAFWLLAPTAVARMLTNPEMSKWLISGAKSVPGTRAASRAMLNVLGFLQKEDLFATPEDAQRGEVMIERLGSDLGIPTPREQEPRKAVPRRIQLSEEQRRALLEEVSP